MDAALLDVPEILDDASCDLASINEALLQTRQLPSDSALDQLLSLIFRHNRSAMSLLERQRGLQLFTDEYRQQLTLLESNQPPSKPLIRLCNELAFGYKHLLQSMLSGRKPSPQHLAWCIFSAQYFICQNILRQYQLYQEPQPVQWHDSHQLYWLAEQHQCLDEPVSSAFIPQPAGTVRGLYQQLLLLTLSNPFHLSEAEIPLLFSALAHYAGLASLQTWDSEEDSDALLIDLHSNLAFQLGERAHLSAGHALRRFDLAALHVALDEPLPLQGQTEQALLQRVRSHWHGKQQRRHQRVEQPGQCEIVVGLPAIHAQLLEHRPEHLAARILDGSPGGLRLLCRPELAPQLPVGQLLLLLPQQNSPRLAMIRWRHQDSKGLHLGLRYLKGLPRAAWLRRAPSAQTHPGIMQSTPVAGGGWHHGLWLTQGQFVEGEHLWLQLHNANKQTVVQLPPSNLGSPCAVRHPLRLA